MECRDISYITGGIVGFPILAIYCLLQGRLDALLLVGLFALVWYLTSSASTAPNSLAAEMRLTAGA